MCTKVSQYEKQGSLLPRSWFRHSLTLSDVCLGLQLAGGSPRMIRWGMGWGIGKNRFFPSVGHLILVYFWFGSWDKRRSKGMRTWPGKPPRSFSFLWLGPLSVPFPADLGEAHGLQYQMSIASYWNLCTKQEVEGSYFLKLNFLKCALWTVLGQAGRRVAHLGL